MSWWYNNEDAGDLAAYNEAEYHAEMNAEREARRRARYVEEFDDHTAPGYWAQRAVVNHPGTKWEWTQYVVDTAAGRLPGPAEPPYCEECCEALDWNSDARYYGPDAVFLHEDCADRYINRPGYSEGREFPTYG